MRYISILIFFLSLTSCDEKVDFSTPAQTHIDQYLSQNELCEDAKKNSKLSEPARSLDTKMVEVPKSLDPFTVADDDMTLGDKNSKLVFIEYFSPTCPHCAYFHKSIYPELKNKYIDTNKIVYVVREFIGNKQDLDAAILARCPKDKDSFFKYTEVILQQQDSWSLSNKYRDILTNIGQLGGTSPEQYSKCLNDDKLVERLIFNTKAAAKTPKFMGTPAFFINGEQFDGAYSVEAISKAIDKKLQQFSGS